MAKQQFKVQFDFTSRKADGETVHRIMLVEASYAKEAENIAWSRRHTEYGAFGTDNAIDCRVIN